MAITKKDIEYIAVLARIKLTTAEKEKMATDLGTILGYIEKLNKVDTEGIEPMAQVTGLENVFRTDLLSEALAEEGGADKLVSQFPHKKDNFLKVKEVFSDRNKE